MLLIMRKRDFRVSAASQTISFVGCRTFDEHKQSTTLVDIRGSNLSDVGSIPTISTFLTDTKEITVSVFLFNFNHQAF